MEDLISREDIHELTKIERSQFKAFRRHGLIDGHVKKISLVKLDKKKTKEKGKKIYSPAGFTYLYPRTILTQISWVLEQRERGKNLMEIQSEYIRKKIEEEEDLKRRVKKYEKTCKVPTGTGDYSKIKQKFIGNAIMALTERIKRDNPERDIKTLVFLVEQEKQQTFPGFSLNLNIKLDVENSQF